MSARTTDSPRDPRGHRRPAARLPPRPHRLAERGAAPCPARSSPPRPGSTPPSSARTSPTSAPTAPAASATTSSTSSTRSPASSASTQDWPVVIVGAGNLGHALANYGGFGSRGFPVVALARRRPGNRRQQVGGAGAAHRRPEAIVGPARSSIGVIATPAGCRPGRRRPAGRGRRHQHPQLRADRADRAGRRRRAQGRPVDRAADPRLPRAAPGGRQAGPGEESRGPPAVRATAANAWVPRRAPRRR